jgi:Fe-S-cluster containining protein
MAVGARLGVSSAELRERYLLPKPGQGGGQRLEVGVGPDGWCLFYQGGCAIHPAKPAMCRLWPFFRWPLSGEAAFKEAASHCPGLRAMDYQGFLAAYEDFKMRMPGESGACGEEVPKET